MADLLLKGGEVIDPAQNVRAKLDVAATDCDAHLLHAVNS